jgi:hypothetical protein
MAGPEGLPQKTRESAEIPSKMLEVILARLQDISDHLDPNDKEILGNNPDLLRLVTEEIEEHYTEISKKGVSDEGIEREFANDSYIPAIVEKYLNRAESDTTTTEESETPWSQLSGPERSERMREAKNKRDEGFAKANKEDGTADPINSEEDERRIMSDIRATAISHGATEAGADKVDITDELVKALEESTDKTDKNETLETRLADRESLKTEVDNNFSELTRGQQAKVFEAGARIVDRGGSVEDALSALRAKAEELIGIQEEQQEAEPVIPPTVEAEPEQRAPAAPQEGGSAGAEGIPETSQESQPATPIEEETITPPGEVEAEFGKVFNISAEDLSTIDGFNELSPGQKALALENLKQITLREVQEGARDKFNKKQGPVSGVMPRVRKFIRGVTKEYQVGVLEKETLEEVMSEGIDRHGRTLNMLVTGMQETGTDAEISEDGKVSIKFLPGTEPLDLKDEERKTADEYNRVANEYARVPHEWSIGTTATKEQREEAEHIRADYGVARMNFMTMLRNSQGGSAEGVAETQNILDQRVDMNRFLVNNPDVDVALGSIQNDKLWAKALKTNVTEKGLYFGLGVATRSISASVLGLAGAPLAAAGFGAWRARKRANEQFVEEEKLSRNRAHDEGSSPEDKQEKLRIRNAYDSLVIGEDLENGIYPADLTTDAEKEEYLRQNTVALDAYRSMSPSERVKLIREHAIFEIGEGARLEAQKKSETLGDVIDAENLTQKIQRLVGLYEIETNGEDSDPERVQRILTSLETRIRFTELKIAKGEVNFGDDKDRRIMKQLDLLQAIGHGISARAVVNIPGWGNPRGFVNHGEVSKKMRRTENKLEGREDKRMDAQKRLRRKKMLQGAGISAGFATAGWIIRDVAGDFWGGSKSVDSEQAGGFNQTGIDGVPVVAPGEDPVERVLEEARDIAGAEGVTGQTGATGIEGAIGALQASTELREALQAMTPEERETLLAAPAIESGLTGDAETARIQLQESLQAMTPEEKEAFLANPETGAEGATGPTGLEGATGALQASTELQEALQAMTPEERGVFLLLPPEESDLFGDAEIARQELQEALQNMSEADRTAFMANPEEVVASITPSTGESFLNPENNTIGTGGPFGPEGTTSSEGYTFEPGAPEAVRIEDARLGGLENIFNPGTLAEIAESIEAEQHIETIREGGSLWRAAKRFVQSGDISSEDFAKAWSNPESTFILNGNEVHISKLDLVHEGDVVVFHEGAGDEPPRFEILQESEFDIGDDHDLADAFKGANKELPEWLQKAIGEVEVSDDDVVEVSPDEVIDATPIADATEVEKALDGSLDRDPNSPPTEAEANVANFGDRIVEAAREIMQGDGAEEAATSIAEVAPEPVSETLNQAALGKLRFESATDVSNSINRIITNPTEFGVNASELTRASRWSTEIMQKMSAEISQVKTAEDADWFIRDHMNHLGSEYYNPTEGPLKTTRSAVGNYRVRYREYSLEDSRLLALQSSVMRDVVTYLHETFGTSPGGVFGETKGDEVFRMRIERIDEMSNRVKESMSYASRKQDELLRNAQ